MVNVVNASSLTLREVQQRFQLDCQLETDLSRFLTLSPLTEAQVARVAGIRQSWGRYYSNGRVTEGEVKILALSPLLIEAGYLAIGQDFQECVCNFFQSIRSGINHIKAFRARRH